MFGRLAFGQFAFGEARNLPLQQAQPALDDWSPQPEVIVARSTSAAALAVWPTGDEIVPQAVALTGGPVWIEPVALVRFDAADYLPPPTGPPTYLDDEEGRPALTWPPVRLVVPQPPDDELPIAPPPPAALDDASSHIPVAASAAIVQQPLADVADWVPLAPLEDSSAQPYQPAAQPWRAPEIQPQDDWVPAVSGAAALDDTSPPTAHWLAAQRPQQPLAEPDEWAPPLAAFALEDTPPVWSPTWRDQIVFGVVWCDDDEIAEPPSAIGGASVWIEQVVVVRMADQDDLPFAPPPSVPLDDEGWQPPVFKETAFSQQPLADAVDWVPPACLDDSSGDQPAILWQARNVWTQFAEDEFVPQQPALDDFWPSVPAPTVTARPRHPIAEPDEKIQLVTQFDVDAATIGVYGSTLFAVQLECAAANLVITGSNVQLDATGNFVLDAVPASLVLSGSASFAVSLLVDPATVAVSTQSASFQYAAYADGALVAFVGKDVTFSLTGNVVLDASAANIVVSPAAVSFAVSASNSPCTVAVQGQPETFACVLLAQGADIRLIGKDADLSQAGAATIDATPASIVIVGQNVDLVSAAEDGASSPKYGAKRRLYPNIGFKPPGKKKRKERQEDTAVPADEIVDADAQQQAPTAVGRAVGAGIRDIQLPADSVPAEHESRTPEPKRRRARKSLDLKEQSEAAPHQDKASRQGDAAPQQTEAGAAATAERETGPTRGLDVDALRRAVAEELSKAVDERVAELRSEMQAVLDEIAQALVEERDRRARIERAVRRAKNNRAAIDLANLLLDDDTDDLW